MTTRTFRIWRGSATEGALRDYSVAVQEGMVVLDAVHRIQAETANDLAVRWNCKAGKCGSCSAEINGRPRLMCMTRLSDLPEGEPVVIEPMRAFPLLRDLVTDVESNYRAKRAVRAFKPRPPDAADGTWRMAQADVDRVQEFRKCIECFLCQDVCHVLRDHAHHEQFVGPRVLVHVAALEMHPLDVEDRVPDLRAQHGIGYCNITKCCTKVCPEGITITDNSIIPLKERVVNRYYDPIRPFLRLVGIDRRKKALRKRGGTGMFELKRLHRNAVPAALAKAERYRLLNEPHEAESICRDILAVEPDNVEAKTMLVLALTDQFAGSLAAHWPEALAAVESFPDSYARAYYRGILHERRAKAHLEHPGRPALHAAASDLRFAMDSFEEASKSAPPGDDSAILRWNTCARILNANAALAAKHDDPSTTFLE